MWFVLISQQTALPWQVRLSLEAKERKKQPFIAAGNKHFWGQTSVNEAEE